MHLKDPLGGIKMAKGHIIIHLALFLVSYFDVPDDIKDDNGNTDNQ